MQYKVQPTVVILWEMTGNAGVIVVGGVITSIAHSVYLQSMQEDSFTVS